MNAKRSYPWRGLGTILLVLLICAGALLIVKAAVALSASTTIHVDSTDGGTGGPECRLRDAISAANTGAVVGGCDGSAGGPFILELIDPGHGSVYEFSVIDNNANALPIITSDITINGHGGTISRSNQESTPDFRLIEVAPAGTLNLNEVTVRGGGVVTEGGNLNNQGNMHVEDVIFQFGRAESGGSINNEGIMTISHSKIINNYGGCGGGIMNQASGVLTVTDSLVLENVGDI
jgi:hypothetical protein